MGTLHLGSLLVRYEISDFVPRDSGSVLGCCRKCVWVAERVDDDARPSVCVLCGELWVCDGRCAGGDCHPGVKVWVERGSPVEATHRMGFLIRKTRSDSAEYVDEYQTSCLLDAFGLGPGEKTEEGDAPAVSDTPMDYISLSNLSTWETGVHFRRVIGPGEDGLYNPGPDYLSEGKSPLPTLYFTFTLLHAVLAVTLVVFMRKPSAVVYKVHYLALAVAILRTLTLF